MTKKIATKNTENWKTFQYGISTRYIPSWDNYGIAREFIANAIDTLTDVQVYKQDETLIITDQGEGIDLRDLFLGESSHPENPDSIGKFGEGFKNAMLVLTRQGKKCVVYSGKMIYKNGSIKTFDVDQFVIYYRESENPIKGTRIEIENWNDETYFDRFVKKNDPRIIYQNSSGSILNVPELHVKTVYVSPANGYKYGYDFSTMDIDVRDRNKIDQYGLNNFVALIMSQCDNLDMWVNFLQACKDGNLEKDASFNWYSPIYKDIVKEAFQSVYGLKACIKTTDYYERESRHCGFNPIDPNSLGKSLAHELAGIVGTDQEKVIEKKGSLTNKITSHHINDIQKKNLAELRHIARKIGFDPKHIELSNLLEAKGFLGESCGDFIFIDPSILNRSIVRTVENPLDSENPLQEEINDPTQAISVFIHELAHWKYNTDDTTDAHVNACTDIAAEILVKYLTHKF